MKANRTVCISLIVSALALAGCNSQPSATDADLMPLTMGQLPSAVEPGTPEGVFPLGAGDALGREMFHYYVACVRAHEHYATGQSPFPADQ